MRSRREPFVGEHAKRRHEVLGEVLVLVIAPHDDHVWFEFIDPFADPSVGAHDVRPVASRGGSDIRPANAELGHHLGGPRGRVLDRVGHAIALEVRP